ncbi:anthranilate synthase component I family protein [Microbacterium sp. ARD32]|uniref:anthranilate synthase component I family protein n=1 Tax=Microbacterium sp. ARD32 TaxID=2962577 RepID=UPI00288185DB|nr:anthranilate synthase component I family protein [Microbacterium sp. ARD32]MDT0157418.1 anthranilate synthase component I family protein [Microbacterium sp. ARD32]
MPAPRPLDALPLEPPQPWRIDAEALFLRLFADAEASFWLDGGVGATEGWSVLGAGEREPDPEAVRAVPLASGNATTSGTGPDMPFRGGWVGWLDYEQGAAAVGAPSASGGSGAAWIAVTRAVAVDHANGRIFALADAAMLPEWRSEVDEALRAPVRPAAAASAAEPVHAVARHDVAEYVGLVERCRDAIERGDAYQLCLTTRFSVPRPADPIAVHRRLRESAPAHHGGCIRVGERWLLSASPELFLAVADGVASTSPIKGTRPRGADAADDARLAAELQADVKERAENVMIVDLMRNDLSHVGVPGTVRVERLWEVESYSAVHQLVSTVSMRLREGVTFGELTDAAFPAGSMTGAPKLSAMTILHGLEGAPRGVYSGCFGHVGLDGRVDLAMVIRSIVIEPDGAHVGAGGGITWLSRADAEAAEVAVKARAPLAALGAPVPAEWAALLPAR